MKRSCGGSLKRIVALPFSRNLEKTCCRFSLICNEFKGSITNKNHRINTCTCTIKLQYMYYTYQKLSKSSVHNRKKSKNHTKCSQIYKEENAQIWQPRTPHTLYLAPLLSFAVQTKRNTFFPLSSSSFEESFRPIAKEARAGLLAFRTLWEAAIRFTIDISQFIRILVFSDENTSKRITFNNLPLSLPPYFDSNHVLTFDQLLAIGSLEPAISFESRQLTLTNLRFLMIAVE